MQVMANTCYICKEEFGSWFDYQEHMSFGAHKIVEVVSVDAKEHESEAFIEECKEVPAAFSKAFSSGRADLKRQEYPGPMPEIEKQLIVARGERRLGLQHFILSMLVILSLSGYSFANCGNDNGNGQGCSGGNQPGPQGPVGPQGANGSDANTEQAMKGGLAGEFDVRVWDTKRTQLLAYDNYRFADGPNRDVVMDGRNGLYGFKFVLKLGSSYEETLIQKQARQIEELREFVILLSK